MNKFYSLLLLLFLPILANAQLLLVEGQVLDAETNQPIVGALVSTTIATAVTDAAGSFEMELAADVTKIDLVITADAYLPYSMEVTITNSDVKSLGVISLSADPNAVSSGNQQIPTLVLSSEDLEDSDNRNEDISGILASSRDVFISTSSYTFGALRFRVRGYDSENTTILMNGIPMNELENGRPYWSTWGGLNDVTRNQETDFGLGAIEYTFGGIGGATNIDTRASNQRKQFSVSYAISNRTYRNRLMATYSTGLKPSGWAFSFSGSRRWAQEGYAPGTFYDAWSYFASVDKKFNDNHSLNFTAFGTPNKRGKDGAAVQELNDLAGTNYYNPYWGFQNGEKRNSRVGHSHQPVLMLRHDWNIGEKATLTNTVSYQFGSNGGTALDWYGARDPRPDYYRYLPSGTEPEFADEVANILANDEAARQIDWDYMYNVNYNSLETVYDVDGISGNIVTGLRSKYIVEDRRYDSKELNWSSIYSNPIGDHLTLNAGLSYQVYEGDNYKLVDDLLGGEFYMDINRFVQRDFPDDPAKWQNDLNNPNRILYEGDRFGYDYASHIRKGNAWAQGVFNFRFLDVFLAGEVSQTTFWREGKVQNGLYPESSFGNSEKQEFLNYGVKGGVTYKINSRNFLYVNGGYLTRAPYFRNSYLSPRVRDEVVDGLTSTKIQSVEGGYILRGATIRARATAYWTVFQDASEVMSFFNDEELTITQIVNNVEESFGVTAGFVNYALTDIDSKHQGVELAFDWTVAAGLSLRGVAAVGRYQYTSRPTSVIINESDPGLFDPVKKTVYQQNFFIPGTPQSAYSAGIRYEGKGYWSVNLNANYFDDIYIDFNPNRRTEEAVASLSPESPQFASIIDQERGDAGFTADFFGTKSFRFNDIGLYLTVGVNNIFNNQTIKTGGYEQLRFDFANQDPTTYPARYYYYYGRNYFISLSFRL
ncbi:MAG: TonB-dependent receptor [Saprospiraceae bacterium]|nr:TonB-dependent receptor [Saprospiraceae bacterium]